MADQQGITELGALRHDLMNVLTSLQHGCTLIGSKLDDRRHEDVHNLLGEMLRRIENGYSLIECVWQLEASDEPTAGTGSCASRRELGEQ